MRQEKLKEFKLGIKKQQFMFTKVSQESEAAVHASYVLSEMIAKHSKPFTEGDFIKECLIKAAEIVCPGSVKTFQAISLSRNTVVERVTHMARNLNDQIKEKSSCFEAFSIACDETCDTDFNIFEELLELVPIHGTTTGEDIFNCVYDLLQKYNLPQSKLTTVATDGAPSRTGKTYDFVALLRKKLSEISDGSNIHHTHCIIHQEVLCTKVIKMKNVLTYKKIINFIRSRGLNQRQFSLFLTDLESEYSGFSYYTEVRWLSCSKVLKQFWDLKEEICQFLITKNQDITLFSDQVWLQDFSFMVDITKHLSDLNLKLQGKDQIITNMCDQVKALKYFQCDSDLTAKFIEVGVSEFYKYLPARFENTRKLAYEIMSMFVMETEWGQSLTGTTMWIANQRQQRSIMETYGLISDFVDSPLKGGELCETPTEVFSDCGAACQPNCSNYETLRDCPDICVPGCVCSEGYVRKTDELSPCHLYVQYVSSHSISQKPFSPLIACLFLNPILCPFSLFPPVRKPTISAKRLRQQSPPRQPPQSKTLLSLDRLPISQSNPVSFLVISPCEKTYHFNQTTAPTITTTSTTSNDTRTYRTCKDCPGVELTATYIFSCPAMAAALQKIDMDPEQQHYTPKIDKVVVIEIVSYSTSLIPQYDWVEIRKKKSRADIVCFPDIAFIADTSRNADKRACHGLFVVGAIALTSSPTFRENLNWFQT
ncbi:hypothetical protein LAZ67_16002706 [Cordylochernes scorpioides]|uniref:TIL domain-containing protein n=1 Tax=Cordylochernes scorpioides TaxID=51811 RepID=A0ABY6LD47_9ARAC|nr:hypothetical protein LAZ67_16002706 [Cordylochernes scorpioides]